MKKIFLLLILISTCVLAQRPERIIVDSSGTKLNISSDGSLDVNIQDQTTRAVIVNFNRIAESTTLSDSCEVDDLTLVVADTTGVANNPFITLFSPIVNNYYVGKVLSVTGANILNLDTPLDREYPIGSFVDFTSIDLAVDGSSTTQVFGVRGVSPSPIGLTVDITRIILVCYTATTPQLNEFGDITALTNGLVLRKRDGTYDNIFNIKDNGDMASLMYDWSQISALGGGQDGFIGRLTFASQGKIGVAIRLEAGEDLEFLVQDDLTGLQLFKVIAEGHIVTD